MPWPQEMVLSGWRRLRIPSPAVLGSGPGVCSRVAGPCPTLAGQPGCPASTLASVSWRPWQRVAPSSCSATASTWTGGSTETPHSSAAACRTVSASAASGREGGRAWAGSQAGAPGHPVPCYLALPASSCLCLQREELDSPRPRRPPGR